MKTCSYCGKEFPDTASVCDYDENPLPVSLVLPVQKFAYTGGDIRFYSMAAFSFLALMAVSTILILETWRSTIFEVAICVIAVSISYAEKHGHMTNLTFRKLFGG